MAYHTAEICKMGHIITSHGMKNQKFCEKCGSEIIHNCPSCNSHIKGVERGDFDCISTLSLPNYCDNCGKPYPWTLEAKESLNELLKLSSEINSEDINFVDNNFDSLIVDTPKTKLLATKLNIMLSEATPVIADAARGLLVDVLSETAKKIMFPGL